MDPLWQLLSAQQDWAAGEGQAGQAASHGGGDQHMRKRLLDDLWGLQRGGRIIGERSVVEARQRHDHRIQ